MADDQRREGERPVGAQLPDLGRQDLPLDACDACGEPMKYQGHCKWRCLSCGFLRTCQDTI